MKSKIELLAQARADRDKAISKFESKLKDIFKKGVMVRWYHHGRRTIGGIVMDISNNRILVKSSRSDSEYWICQSRIVAIFPLM